MTDERASQPTPAVPVALWLGYAGLLPFVAGVALCGLLPPEAQRLAASTLAAYAAVIVSFLGGIHWGIGFRAGTPSLFVWGVVPSLVATGALLLPPRSGLLLLGAMLLLCYLVDRRIYSVHGLAAWLTLRMRLSLVAATSCFVGAALC